MHVGTWAYQARPPLVLRFLKPFLTRKHFLARVPRTPCDMCMGLRRCATACLTVRTEGAPAKIILLCIKDEKLGECLTNWPCKAFALKRGPR